MKTSLIFSIGFLLVLICKGWIVEGAKSKPKTPKPESTTISPSITLADKVEPGSGEGPDHELKRPNNNNESLLVTETSSLIRFGAFNIRKFGMPKANNKPVLDILVKVTRSEGLEASEQQSINDSAKVYDLNKEGLRPIFLIFIQQIILRYEMIAVSEITDVTEKGIKRLIQEVNFHSPYVYHYVVSIRVGRTNNKEQYALIYRPDIIKVKNHFLYNDAKNDSFAREPMIAQLVVKGDLEEQEIALVSIHVKPADAVAEINALTQVQKWIEKRLKIKDVVMLGDLNADCQYVPKKAWKSIGLRTDDKFVWLIGDEVDTTVGKSDCAYDRIVISGPFLRQSVIYDSAQPFTFDKSFGLNESMALQVSDHYPVEFLLRLSGTPTSSGINKSNLTIIDIGLNQTNYRSQKLLDQLDYYDQILSSENMDVNGSLDINNGSHALDGGTDSAESHANNDGDAGIITTCLKLITQFLF